MPTDEDYQDGTFFFNHPSKGEVDLQAAASSPKMTSAEEHIATTPGCGPTAGHRAFARADTRRGTHRHYAGL